jgi:hypothetical protein
MGCPGVDARDNNCCLTGHGNSEALQSNGHEDDRDSELCKQVRDQGLRLWPPSSLGRPRFRVCGDRTRQPPTPIDAEISEETR